MVVDAKGLYNKSILSHSTMWPSEASTGDKRLIIPSSNVACSCAHVGVSRCSRRHEAVLEQDDAAGHVVAPNAASFPGVTRQTLVQQLTRHLCGGVTLGELFSHEINDLLTAHGRKGRTGKS